MRLGSNRLIPILALGVLALAGLVLVMSFSADEESTFTPGTVPTAPAADADSPAETIRTLTAEVAHLRNQAETLRRSNLEADRRLDELHQGVIEQVRSEIESRQRLAPAPGSSVADQAIDALQQRLEDLARQVERVASRPPVPADPELPVGLGLDGLPKGLGDGTTALVWVKPLEQGGGASAAGGAGGPGPGLLAGLPGAGRLLGGGDPEPTARDSWGMASRAGDTVQQGAATAESMVTQTLAELAPEPVYTIPRNATLMGSTSMTALVGRIPIKGAVQDPMPFKVIVGPDNLAANGLTIPGLDGIVASGTAMGDWTLSCVTGRIVSLTFVFQDGTIVTHSADDQNGGGAGSGRQEGLGWISDDQGIPCVSGERITNAPSFLTQRLGLILARGAAEGYALSQTTNTTSALGNQSTSVTGSVPGYVVGKATSEGVDEVGKWLEERQASSFDAVFVRPGATLAIHIDREIPIDYDPTGRKVSYETAVDSRYSARLD